MKSESFFLHVVGLKRKFMKKNPGSKPTKLLLAIRDIPWLEETAIEFSDDLARAIQKNGYEAMPKILGLKVKLNTKIVRSRVK